MDLRAPLVLHGAIGTLLVARGNAHRVFRLVLAGESKRKGEGRSFSPSDLRDQDDGERAGEGAAVRRWLCFGEGHLLGYTSRPVVELERLTGGVRRALEAGRGSTAAHYSQFIHSGIRIRS